MYTGTLIDDLMKTVEHTQRCAIQARSEDEKLAYFYAVSQFELAQFESTLAGAA